MKKYAGIIGIGFMYVWAMALLKAIDIAGRNEWTLQYAWGMLLACFVSASCLAIFLYTSNLERESNELAKRVKDLDESLYFHVKRGDDAIEAHRKAGLMGNQ
jgi:hypothetical protein